MAWVVKLLGGLSGNDMFLVRVENALGGLSSCLAVCALQKDLAHMEEGRNVFERNVQESIN